MGHGAAAPRLRPGRERAADRQGAHLPQGAWLRGRIVRHFILQFLLFLPLAQRKQFDRAIEDLKAFEKKDRNLKAMAANNLSFLYFLEGNLEQAFRYAELAVEHDRYNAKALVNLGATGEHGGMMQMRWFGPSTLLFPRVAGNCLCEQGELERAKELFLEAIGVEADCIEAIFNLGLVNKQLGILSEALQAFEKLHTIVPAAPEVIYHIANLCVAL